MPETGMPAPCNVAAFAANYVERVNFTVDLVRFFKSRGRSSLGSNGGGNGSFAPLPNYFVGVDNESNQIRGLRRETRDDQSIWVVDNSIAAQSAQPAPLTGKERKTFEEKQRKASERLNDKDCKKFLEKIKSYASIKDIDNKIYTHPAFSAKNTSLKVRDSGIYSPEQIREIERLPLSTNHPDYPGNLVAVQSLNKTVSDYIKTQRAYAITNQDPSIPGVYYYEGYDSQTVLHESIHFATGLNDVDLANALGLKDQDGKAFVKGERDAASYAIKNALNRECR